METILLAYRNKLTQYKQNCINFGLQSSQAEQGAQEVREAGAAAFRQVGEILASAKKRHEELLAMGMLKTAPDVQSAVADIRQLTHFQETFTESEVKYHLNGGVIVEGGQKARRKQNWGCGCGCGMPIFLFGIFGLYISIIDYRNGCTDLLFEGFCFTIAALLIGGSIVALSLWKLYRISRER